MALTFDLLMESHDFGNKVLKFLDGTGSPYHSVRQILKFLDESKIHTIPLNENEVWSIQNGRCYTVTDYNGTLLVFYVGKNFDPEAGRLTISAVHTDSPCLKLDCKCSTESKGYNQISVCTYGGGLWHTWLDRDLGLAGKVVLNVNGDLEDRLIHLREPLVIVPNLAVHLQNAQEREAFRLNKETHLRGIISTQYFEQTTTTDDQSPLLKLLAEKLRCKPRDIVDFDLCLMDNTPAVLSGVNKEFITSGRLDNLISCFATVHALAEHINNPGQDRDIVGLVAYNYEEVGSKLGYGADSTITRLWLDKIWSSFGVSFSEKRLSSFLLVCDMAHAVHPNYPEKHLETYSPQFHRGVVIKRNVNGRYTTDLRATPTLISVAKSVNVPLQNFRVGNDTPCGSTVGPSLSSHLCIPAVDVGVPQLAMHSIRETCSLIDSYYLYVLIKGLFKRF